MSSRPAPGCAGRADPEERHTAAEKAQAEDREEVVAPLLNFVWFFRNDPERHDPPRLFAPHTIRSFDRGGFEALTRRRVIAIDGIQTVAVAAYADHFTLHACRVQSPVDGVTDQEQAHAAEDKCSREHCHLVQGGHGVENELKHRELARPA
jgi:hypothetical protein